MVVANCLPTGDDNAAIPPQQAVLCQFYLGPFAPISGYLAPHFGPSEPHFVATAPLKCSGDPVLVRELLFSNSLCDLEGILDFSGVARGTLPTSIVTYVKFWFWNSGFGIKLAITSGNSVGS